jgi:radical SAM superfamily enzyme YgiQ (UPF0313 family)
MANIILCGGISWTTVLLRPVGTYQLANVLRDNGYTVQVIDNFPYIANRGVDVVKQIFDKFVTSDTLWIGFSSTWFTRINEMLAAKQQPTNEKTTPIKNTSAGFVYKDTQTFLDNTFLFNEDEVRELKEFVYSKNKNCKFVLGGGRAPLGRIGARPGFIDCYIEGYADGTVLEYTKYLEGKNKFLPIVNNPDGSISITHDHKASTFDYKNHKFTWHETDLVREREVLPMEIARGCIFQCSFCAYPLNGRKKLDYLKNPDILKDQLEENYDRFKTTDYFFLDDTFNDSVEKLEILNTQVFSKLKFKINFVSYMRLDLINAHRESIDLLKDMGCGGMMFGIESLNTDSLKSIGKGITKDKIRDTLSLIKQKIPEALIDSQFIVGLPHESEESVKSWIEEVCDPSYPLDYVRIHGLSMNYNKMYNNIWQSDFEKYPEKYGYTFIDNNRSNWVNNKGMTSSRAWKICEEMQSVIKQKEGMSWLVKYGLKNMGASDHQIETMNNGQLFRLGTELRKQSTSDYIQQLLNYKIQ